jgi:FkbM family methyltransferase
MQLHENSLLRRICLPLLARFSPGDITIRHHYTGDDFRLHCYRHKGYWYHGKHREEESMRLFRRFVRPGATVLDVGGHIGYVALSLAQLVGPRGRVFAFEPGENNLPYLRHNTREKPNVTVVPRAAGNCNARCTFYIENLTGQNNSLVADFDVFEANRARAYAADARTEEAQVDVITLDRYCREADIRPAFIKIDVEGFEREVLQGATGLLSQTRPMLMVEIQRAEEEIIRLARDHRYRLFTPEGARIQSVAELPPRPANTFWLPDEAKLTQI